MDFILDSWLFTGQRTFFMTGDYHRTNDIIQEMWLFIGPLTIQDRWLFIVHMTFSTTGDFSQDKWLSLWKVTSHIQDRWHFTEQITFSRTGTFSQDKWLSPVQVTFHRTDDFLHVRMWLSQDRWLSPSQDVAFTGQLKHPTILARQGSHSLYLFCVKCQGVCIRQRTDACISQVSTKATGTDPWQ